MNGEKQETGGGFKSAGVGQTRSALRTAFFFTAFFFVCLASALYAVGNDRNFTERTQFFLLNAVICSGAFTALCALLDFAFCVGIAAIRRKPVPAMSFVFLIMGALCFIFSGVAVLIAVFAKGNAG